MTTKDTKIKCHALAVAVTTLIGFGLTPSAAHAQEAGLATTDSRIRTIAYSEDTIVALRGHLGYQMLIEFDPAERIENVAIGDSLAWQVTPNHAATLLFLKPLISGAATNMTVITTMRRYSFELRAQQAQNPSDPNIIYTVRFSYPPSPATEPETPRTIAPQVVNLNYSLRGGDRFGGVHVFDDGVKTYFQFPDNVEAPAILVLGENGREELVNTQTRPPYVVVDAVARGFVLRSGRHRLNVRNDGYAIPATSHATSPVNGARP